MAAPPLPPSSSSNPAPRKLPSVPVPSVAMTVAYDSSFRGWSSGSHGAVCLEDKFEVLKDVGDGSFGSVSLARVRSAGAHIARRGTLVRLPARSHPPARELTACRLPSRR